MRVVAGLLAVLAGCPEGGALSSSRLPISTSTAEIPASEALVSIDASAVRLDGDSLTTVDEMLRGPSRVAVLEAALRARAAAIAAEAAKDPKAPSFQGALGIELDRDLPADVLSRVVSTANLAGFGKPWVVVAGTRGGRYGIKVALPEVAAAGVAAAEAAGEVAIGGYANPLVTVGPSFGFVVAVQDKVIDPGTGLALPCSAIPCGDTLPTVELNRLARRIKLDHPKDRAAIVAPAEGATVQMVVTTFDALRDDTFAGRGTRELFPEALIGLEVP